MWVEHPSSLALLRLLRETMDNAAQGRVDSPTNDKVTSAADAMLKLSSSASPEPSALMRYSPSGSHPFAQVSQGQTYPSMVSPSGTYSHQYVPQHDEESSDSNFRHSRKQREFIPENKKDDCYWAKRRKNNDAAKRSREKRRLNDMAMSEKIMELTDINSQLQMELNAIKRKFGWPVDRQFPFEGEVPITRREYISNSDSELSNPSFTSGLHTAGSNISGIPTSAKGSVHGDVAPNSSERSQAPSFHNSGIPNTDNYPSAAMPNRGSEVPAATAQKMPELLPIVPHQVQSLIPAAAQACLPRPAMESGTSYMSDRTPQADDNDHPPPPAPLPLIYSGEGMRFPFTAGYHPALGSHDKNGAKDMSRSPGGSSRSSSPELKINLSGVSNSSSEHSEPDMLMTKSCASENRMGLSAPHAFVSSQAGAGLRYHSELAQAVENSRGMGRKGVPFKLWHKLSSSESQRDHQQELDDEMMADNDSDRQTVSSTSSNHQDSFSTLNQYLDPRYLERRRRNNMAARKCRENRKMLNDVRLHKSNLMEAENNKLRDELRDLCTEVSGLRQLLDKKKQAEASGEHFTPPPLSDISKSSQDSPEQHRDTNRPYTTENN